MFDRKDPPKSATDRIFDGAAAAKALAASCESSSRKAPSLRLEAVRYLALDLERHLEGLASGGASPDLLAEAAQKCADLATLAVCNAKELDPPRDAEKAVRLAAEAADFLSRTVESAVPDEGERNDIVRRDARSASWKASLAARQMEGLLENE